MQIFVLAGNKSHKFSLFDFVRLVAATEFCCGRTNIFTKISSTDGAICRCDVSVQRVATTCHPVCSDLKDPGKQSRFQGISSFWEQGWLRRGGQKKARGGTMGRGREKIDTFLVFPSRGRSWRFKDLFIFILLELHVLTSFLNYF